MNAVGFMRSAAALVLALSATVTHAITIDWVTVGDPGNAADTTGYGAVAASFQIMKFEFTNQQYVEFLNAVDPNGTNPYSIYHTSMGSNAKGGISYTAGNPAGTKYALKTNMGDKPVNYVNWFDAARVANWLMNGATITSSTETGAYTLSGSTSGTAPAVNPGATFYVPTEDQWYKAAYYKGGSTNAGYWEYATQVTGTAPTPVGATTLGSGTSGGVSPVTSGNFANFMSNAAWNTQTGNVTTVGTNGGPSAYGAFDMSGNVSEWNDLTGAAEVNRGLRGGSWGSTTVALSTASSGNTTTASGNSGNNGFRLARPDSSPSGVPEIDPAGIGSVLALVAGAFALLARRRLRS